MSTITNLTTIANKHKTDKGTVYYEAHGYTETYSMYIPQNCVDCTLLEIGVWHGDSIRMWNEYNPSMNVLAIDNDPNVKNYLTSNENVELYIGDQSNHIILNTILSTAKNINFVIDDGSHAYSDIMASFNFIFPKLNNGSIYFIEDLHASCANRDRVISDIEEILTNLGIPHSNMQLMCNDKLLIIFK